MITPTNSHFAQHWHLKVIEAEEAWQSLRDRSIFNGAGLGTANDLTFGSAGIYIAVIDQGLDTAAGVMQSPAFQGNVSNGDPKGGAFYNWRDTNVAGTQFPNADNDATLGAHGMQCVGIAAAKANFMVPYVGSNVVGVAPNSPVIGIIDSNSVQGELREFYWLTLPVYQHFRELSGGTTFIPAGNGLSAFVPANQDTDVVSISLGYPLGSATTMTNLRQGTFAMTVLGRGGRGIFVAVASGNDGGATSANQAASQFSRINLIGATGIRNNHTPPYYLQDEIRASYSNYGPEVTFAAPAGDTANGQDRFKTYTTTMKEGGTIDNAPLITLSLNNATNNSLMVRMDCVNPGGAKGLFKGQYIAFGNSAMEGDFEVQRILQVNTTTNQIWVKDIKSRTNGSVVNMPANVAAKSTLTSVGGAHTPTSLVVDSVSGFQDGQTIFVGDPTGGPGTGEFVAITTVTGGNTLNFAALAHDPYPDGTIVVAGQIQTTVSVLTPNAGTQFQPLNVATTQGFEPGMKVVLNGNFQYNNATAGTTYMVNQTDIVTTISTVDSVAGTISVLVPGGNWIGIDAGVTIEAVGFGEFDTDFIGTSAATPACAGVASLVLAADPDLSWLEVREILKETADKIDLKQNDANGRWLDENGDRIFDGFLNTFQDTVTGKDLASPASQGDTQITITPNTTNLEKGMAIRIGGLITHEFAVIIDVLPGNILLLDRRLQHNYNAGKAVKGGRKPHKSGYYGYGRVNAKRAVDAALFYDHDHRDLHIRNDLTDAGNAPTVAANVDSPDIWVRNTPPGVDLGAALSAYGVAPNHENPIKHQNKWVYVRIRNRGTQLDSLEGTQLRVSVMFTNDNANPISLPFPRFWLLEQSFVDGGNNYETKYLSPDFDTSYPAAHTDATIAIGDRILSENTALPAHAGRDWTNPHIIPPIAPGDDYIAVFPWPATFVESINVLDEVYIMAQITPFDGVTAGTQVHENNNLSYKKVVFSEIELKDGTGGIDLGKDIEVETSGTTVLQDFKVDVKQIDPGIVDNIVITTEMQFSDGVTPNETVVYQKTGSWGFGGPPPAWMNIVTPVLSGASVPLQELIRFAGTFTVTNAHAKIKMNVKVTDGPNTVIERDFEVDVKAVAPADPLGVGRAQTHIMDTFVNFDQLPAQGGGKNYGPISDTEFRTAAMFNGVLLGAGRQKAFATTSGHAFLQEVQGEPTLVNLILRPDKQTWNGYSKVKYFVYRGLLKSSFLDGGGEPWDQANSDNDMLNRMWVVKNQYNVDKLAADPMYVAVPIKRSDLGLTETGSPIIPDATPIEEMFNTYTFQATTLGWHIGDFDHTGGKDYGFEVIVDGPGPELTLGDVRTLDNKITITYTGAQPKHSGGQEEDIKTKLERDKCLNYMDPVAWFGQMADQKINLRESTGDTELNTIDDVYTNILAKFDTKEKVYVDIRNDLNSSINLYGQYGDGTALDVAQVKFEDATATVVDRAYHTNGWPILILDGADFAPNAVDDKLKIKLQVPNGDNTEPCLYLTGARLYSEFPADFLKFNFLTPGATHSNAFELGVLNNKTQSKVVPGAIKLQNARRYDPGAFVAAAFPGNVFAKEDLIDLLLTPRSLEVTGVADHVVFDSEEDLRYNGWTSFDGVDFTLRSGKAVDDIGEVLYAFVYGPAELAGGTSEAITQKGPSLEKGKEKAESLYEYLSDKKFITVDMKDIAAGPTVSIPRVLSTEDNYSADLTSTSANNLVTLAYTSGQAGDIQTAIAGFYSEAPIYYVAMNHNLKADTAGEPYFEMELGVQGVEYNAGTFTHQINRVNTNIKFYSFDGRHYISEDYGTAVAALLPF